jgi:DNA-directed RNA polymerase specialized sigma24 family protein
VRHQRSGWSADIRSLHASQITFDDFYRRQQQRIARIAKPWIAAVCPAVTSEDVQQEICLAIVRAIREWDGSTALEAYVSWRIHYRILRFNEKWTAIDRHERRFFSFQIAEEKIIHVDGQAIHLAEQPADQRATALASRRVALASGSTPEARKYVAAILDGQPIDNAVQSIYWRHKKPRKAACRAIQSAIEAVEST